MQLATCREQTNTTDGRHTRPRPPPAACAVRLSLCYFCTSVQYAAVEKLLRAAESALRRPLLHATNGGVPRLTLAALQLAPAADRVKARRLQPPCRVPASTHHRVGFGPCWRAPYAFGSECYCCAHWLCCGTKGRLPVSHVVSVVCVVCRARAVARLYVAPLCLATAVCCILPHSLCALRWARLPPAMRSAMCEFQVQGVQYGAQSI
jgi:hypothetical protein